MTVARFLSRRTRLTCAEKMAWERSAILLLAIAGLAPSLGSILTERCGDWVFLGATVLRFALQAGKTPRMGLPEAAQKTAFSL
ncbi:MAG: hypothetical protein AAGF27_11395 [Pseudomonadota bacterium]